MEVTNPIVRKDTCPAMNAGRTRPGLQGGDCGMGAGRKAPHHVCNGRRRRSQHGQAYLEYLLIALVLCIALFHGEPGAMKKMLIAIQQNYAHFSYAMSLP